MEVADLRDVLPSLQRCVQLGRLPEEVSGPGARGDVHRLEVGRRHPLRLTGAEVSDGLVREVDAPVTVVGRHGSRCSVVRRSPPPNTPAVCSGGRGWWRWSRGRGTCWPALRWRGRGRGRWPLAPSGPWWADVPGGGWSDRQSVFRRSRVVGRPPISWSTETGRIPRMTGGGPTGKGETWSGRPGVGACGSTCGALARRWGPARTVGAGRCGSPRGAASHERDPAATGTLLRRCRNVGWSGPWCWPSEHSGRVPCLTTRGLRRLQPICLSRGNLWSVPERPFLRRTTLPVSVARWRTP